jgi:putative flippase GtrA
MKPLLQQFGLFSTVGIFSTIIDIGMLLALIELGSRPYLAITASFLLGLGVNLWLHASITFQSRLKIEKIGRFLLVIGINYGLTLSVVFIFEQLGLGYLLGKIVSLPLLAIHGFFWSRIWVFKP